MPFDTLRPARLLVADIGPFGTTPWTCLNFLVPERGSADGSGAARTRAYPNETAGIVPCDLLVVHGPNGSGKTKLLEAIHGLFDLLSCRSLGLFANYDRQAVPDLSGRQRRLPKAQLDLFAICSIDGHVRPIVLSLWFGSREPIDPWTGPTAMRRAVAGREWVRVGFDVGETDPAPGTNVAGLRFLEAVRVNERMPLFESLEGWRCLEDRRALPTVLHMFRSRIAGATDAASAWLPGAPLYAPASRFDFGGTAIPGIESDLARIARNDPRRFDAISRRLRARVLFNASHVEILTAIPSNRVFVTNDGETAFPLHALSGGEGALLSVHAAAELKTNGSTLLLLDDLTTTVSRDRTDELIRSLFALTGRRSDLMLVVTTHDIAFARRVSELGADSHVRTDCQYL